MHRLAATVKFRASVLLIGVLIAIALLASACQRREIAYAFRTFSATGWDSADTVNLALDSLEAADTYVLMLHVRVATTLPHYPYTEIVLGLSHELYADSLASVATDTLCLALTSDNGDMEGRGTSLLQIDYPIDTLALNTGTHGRFAVTHLMRRDPLAGIHDVGLSLNHIDEANPQ